MWVAILDYYISNLKKPIIELNFASYLILYHAVS